VGSTYHRPTGGVPGSGGGTSAARVRKRALGLERGAGEASDWWFQVSNGLWIKNLGFCVGI
jgi:hypothetical protein